MDARASNGGYRQGAGRKSKMEELGLKEKLQPIEGIFLKNLFAGVRKSNATAMKMYAEYFYGKPTERIEHSGIGGKPIQTEGKHVVEFIDYGGGNTAAVQSAIQAGIRN